MVSEGDIAIGKAKVENGIVMVPLRQVAEKLGFKVTWDGAAESVHLTDGTRQITVKLGVDSYAYSAAKEGLAGMSAPASLGAAAYEAEGTTWAPAELFNLLVEGSPVRLNDDVLYI
ncbi:copper amine oxidase N-terminal domain-containing protein [Intestinibacillus massiliensis]|uniref:copper amine oxidase N-terminal domain-containing protein n=1 Tax=Intestinibacillus massiliensis TaxID=1871029 RepID=UPI002287590B|nr:copper amine oxidase N-terminal domain-containing protein [Intestinibacillus massiliensis]